MQATEFDRYSGESYGLIASDKVEGTHVFSSDGERLGKIDRVMIDKLSGNVAYAVMSFGNLGGGHYPIPWSMLTYNTRFGGYELSVSDVQLQGAPRFADDDQTWEYKRDAEDQLYRYYNTPPYWAA